MKTALAASLLVTLLLAACSTSTTQTINFQVQVNNPIKGRVAIAPFVAEPTVIFWRGRNINLAEEFESYLSSLLRNRSPALQIVSYKLQPPNDPLKEWLKKETWRQIASAANVDYIVTGAISVDAPQYVVKNEGPAKKQISKPRLSLTIIIVAISRSGEMAIIEELRFSPSEDEPAFETPAGPRKSFFTSPFYDQNFPKEKILFLFTPRRIQVTRYLL